LDKGQRTKDKGQRTKDKGQRTKDKGQRTKDKGQRTKDKLECKEKLQVFLTSVTFIYTNNSSRRNSASQLSCEFGCFSPLHTFYPPNTAGNKPANGWFLFQNMLF
jgi:acetyl-CoA carboxylase carboxyltransferase component